MKEHRAVFYKREILLHRVKFLRSFFELGRGLSFSRRLKRGEGVILVMNKIKSRKFCAITMLFVFQSLDVIFLDDNYKIIDMKRMFPFEFAYIPKEKPEFVLETNTRIVERFKIGDFLEIK